MDRGLQYTLTNGTVVQYREIILLSGIGDIQQVFAFVAGSFGIACSFGYLRFAKTIERVFAPYDYRCGIGGCDQLVAEFGRQRSLFLVQFHELGLVLGTQIGTGTDKGIVILLDQLLSLGFDGGLVTFVNGFYALEKFVVKVDGIAVCSQKGRYFFFDFL